MVRGERVSGTFETKAQALAWEAEQRVTRKGGAAVAGLHTCSDAFDRYEREVSRTKRGARWEAMRLAAMKLSSLGPVRVSDVTAMHVSAWRDKRLETVKGATVNREMNLLSHVFTIARLEWKWIAASPTTDVRRPKDSPSRDRRITPKEIEAVCLVLGWRHDAVGEEPTTKQHRIALAFLFAIETAMRAGEICKLTPADVSGRVARLRLTKNGYDRDVALSPRALELWAMVPGGFGLTADILSALFRKARDKAGIPDLNFHDSRHEAITKLAKRLNVLELARMVGHRDIRQLQTYFNATADEIAGKL